MLTGSLATSYHGAPRATQDIDVVISPDRAQLLRLLASFSGERTALEALNDESQFNVIDLETGWKIDFIIRRSRPFSRVEFERRKSVEVGGVSLVVATAEDVLIVKLEWGKIGQSERQLEDVAGVLRVSGDDLDYPYIERWVANLGLAAEWARAQSRAGLS
jgi:hypothetical protein